MTGPCDAAADTLTDEEVGRRWAAMMGKKPWRNNKLPFSLQWQWDRSALHEWIFVEMNWQQHYQSEVAAYAALGRALKVVWRQVPRLPETP